MSSRTGLLVPRRRMIMHTCGQCVNRCNEKLTLSQRQDIFHNFWLMSDHTRQRDFICSHVTAKQKKRNRTEKSRRKKTYHYFLSANGQKVKVCKAVFLSTLNIGERMVSYTLNHALTNTGQGIQDRRGRHPPGFKKAPELFDFVREHINSFPKMESHYARKNTSKKFLESTLNIRKMYHLYVTKCTAENKECVSEKIYGNIFRNDFNLGFHRPQKDECNFCTKFKNLSASEKTVLMDEYNKHMHRKAQSRLEKEKLKAICKSDPSVVAVAFDLQQVLCCPKLNVSALYYKRKLSTYDLTVYNLGDKSVTCYMWHEAVGGRGSCEVATCLN